jgi:hypothetical protein
MRTLAAWLIVGAGCSTSSTGPTAQAELLVPSELGFVSDFAVGSDTLYPIVGSAHGWDVVSCPGFVCDANPTPVGQLAADTQGRGVAVDDANIYWIGRRIGDSAMLMTAAIADGRAHLLQEFPQADILPPLRAYRGSVYFNLRPHAGWVQTTSVRAADGAMSTYPDLAAMDATDGDALDLHDGMLAVNHPTGASSPVIVEDLAKGQGVVVGSSPTPVTLAVGAQATVFSGDGEVLYASDNARPAPIQFGGAGGSALAVDDNGVYYPGWQQGPSEAIVTCRIEDALHDQCSPAELVDVPTFTVSAMQVADGVLYIAGEGLWRVKL